MLQINCASIYIRYVGSLGTRMKLFAEFAWNDRLGAYEIITDVSA